MSDDWIGFARELQVRDELARRKRIEDQLPDRKREQEILAAEENWMERVAERVKGIASQWVYIRMKHTPKGLELSSKGTAEIQFLGHENFAIKYLHIVKPSSVTISKPITIYHHRMVRVRELNSHNIEEVM